MRRLLPAIISFVILAACSKTPEYVIPEGKMAEIMADIHTGEAVIDANSSTFRQDSIKRAFLQSICLRHNVTTQELDTSLYWYGHNLQEYMKVYDKTIEILESRIADAEKAGGKSDKRMQYYSLDGDSVNLWSGEQTIRNSVNNPTDFRTFYFTSDKNWDRGDRYTVTVYPINTRSEVFLAIAVNYNDGTAEYVSLNQNFEGRKASLTLVLDSVKSATSVYGTIHYSPVKGEISYLDSISVVRTRGHNDNVVARQNQKIVRIR